MYFDRFDILDAWYLALAHAHGGQWSDSYRRLCRITRDYHPSRLLSVNTLSENAFGIYCAAVERLMAEAR